jgi:hypothetical protein
MPVTEKKTLQKDASQNHRSFRYAGNIIQKKDNTPQKSAEKQRVLHPSASYRVDLVLLMTGVDGSVA